MTEIKTETQKINALNVAEKKQAKDYSLSLHLQERVFAESVQTSQ